MTKRCVFSNPEVVIQEQPHNTIENIITNAIEEKENKKEVVETKKVKKTEKPKKEKVKEIAVPKVGRYDRPCRTGWNLYTVSANVKIGEDKFNIQKVIEEKTDKLANIEYDRMLKKEYGKPKSITKRTIREYINGDEEFCNKVEIVIEKREESPEMIEFNKKIELLDSDYIGLFKVTFLKNNYFDNSTKYFYACDRDDAIKETKGSAQRGGANPDIVEKNIKDVIRMNNVSIKTDKACLKVLAETSLEDIETMYKESEERQEKMMEEATKKYKEALDKGFKLYICKILAKNQGYFIELARTEEEANNAALGEEKFANLIKSKIKVEGFGIKTFNEAIEESSRVDEANKEKFKEIDVELLKDLCGKNDILPRFLFGKQTVEAYIKMIDEANVAMEKIKAGKGKEIIEERLNNIVENLKQSGLDFSNIKQVEILKKHQFENGAEFLRSLFK